jgi:phosphate transport system substrate-binding protein
LKRMRFLAAAAVVTAVALALAAFAAASAKKESITGAGSTFVAPLVAQWTAHYSAADINYSAVGSGAGIAQISARTVDFGASDAPMTPDQFKACHGCVQIPWAFAATAVSYNVTGVGYGLKLTGPIVAGIYLGHIKKWNDHRIKAVNKGVNLPNENIVPIFRSDGSGTSFNFTDYLSHVSKEWKSKIGKSTQPAFPTGVGARGSSGVAAKLGTTSGGITYFDVAYAYKIRNRAGKFILPGVKSLTAVSQRVKKVPKNNAISVVDPPKSVTNGYPICTFTWVIVPLKTAKAPQLKPFIDWAVTKGQQYGHPLLFLKLPKAVVTAARHTTARLHT